MSKIYTEDQIVFEMQKAWREYISLMNPNRSGTRAGMFHVLTRLIKLGVIGNLDLTGALRGLELEQVIIDEMLNGEINE